MSSFCPYILGFKSLRFYYKKTPLALIKRFEQYNILYLSPSIFDKIIYYKDSFKLDKQLKHVTLHLNILFLLI